MNKKSTIFEKTYQGYLSQIGEIDLSDRSARLGLDHSEGELLISLFNTEYRVSSTGVLSLDGHRAGFAESIVMFKYILMCPKVLPVKSDWVAYHAFKNAQPLLNYFAREAVKPIEDGFARNLAVLEQAGKNLGGSVVMDNAAYDLSIQFNPLSRIPLFLRFNDRDEDFPAQCTLLFRASAEQYLDMESLGILGALFAKNILKDAPFR